jgi:hypothetical protein
MTCQRQSHVRESCDEECSDGCIAADGEQRDNVNMFVHQNACVRAHFQAHIILEAVRSPHME